MTSGSDTGSKALGRLVAVTYDIAKDWWGWATLVRCLALAAGITGIVQPQTSKIAAGIVVVLSVIGEMCALRSDLFRSSAERLLRRLELHDGLGIPVSAAEVADLRASLAPRHVREVDHRSADDAPYFATNEEVGARRLLLMIEESAWKTKQMASAMFIAYASVFVTLVLLSLGASIAALEAEANATTADIVARTVIAVIGFAFSATVFRHAFGYHRLVQGAAKSESSAGLLCRAEEIATTAALQVTSDYQFLRAAAPPIPTFVWMLKKKRLDEEWLRRQRAAPRS